MLTVIILNVVAPIKVVTSSFRNLLRDLGLAANVDHFTNEKNASLIMKTVNVSCAATDVVPLFCS